MDPDAMRLEARFTAQNVLGAHDHGAELRGGKFYYRTHAQKVAGRSFRCKPPEKQKAESKKQKSQSGEWGLGYPRSSVLSAVEKSRKQKY